MGAVTSESDSIKETGIGGEKKGKSDKPLSVKEELRLRGN